MPDWASLRAEFPLLDRYVYVGGLGTLASGLPLPPGRDKVLIGALGFPLHPRERERRCGIVTLEHGMDLVLQHVAARK